MNEGFKNLPPEAQEEAEKMEVGKIVDTDEMAEEEVTDEGKNNELMFEIKDTQELAELIISQMREKIKNTSYKVIIGDDTSGRVPTLMFRNFFCELYDQQGKQKPETYFVAGKREHKEHRDYGALERFKTFFEKIKLKEKVKKGERVLVVTDFIESGSALAPISELLGNELGLSFDIVSLGIQHKVESINKLQVNSNGDLLYGEPENENRLYYGKVGYLPSVFHKKHLSGVKNEINDQELHARRYFDDVQREKEKEIFEGRKELRDKYPNNERFQSSPTPEIEDFLRARKEIKIASHQLVEDFIKT